jgi:hypothetical protein
MRIFRRDNARGRLDRDGPRVCGIRLILDNQCWRSPLLDMSEDALPTVAVDAGIIESTLR